MWTHTHTHTLTLTPHAHSIHHVRRPGAILHPGTLVATLDLDDPSRVREAKKSTDVLPQMKEQSGRGDKVHQVCTSDSWYMYFHDIDGI